MKEHIRTDIYKRKKTFFSEQELVYGSPLANKVIEFILYAKDGLYRGKKPACFTGKSAEVKF